MRQLAVLCALALAAVPALAQDRPLAAPAFPGSLHAPGRLDRMATEDVTGRPPLELRRVGLELAGSYCYGLAGMMVGAVAGFPVAYVAGGEAGIAVSAALVGYCLGTGVGAYRVGCTDEQTGSLYAALTGSVVAGVLAGLPTQGVGLFYASPVGAVIGFNATRRSRVSASPHTPLLSVRERTVQLGVPAVRCRGRLAGSGRICCEIDLVRVRF